MIKRWTLSGLASLYWLVAAVSAGGTEEFDVVQALHFQRLMVEDGLSQANAWQILQDRRGFIWIATEDGLNRYDGHEIRVFKTTPGDETTLGSNFIYALREGQDGALWVLTKAGLDIMDPASGQVERLDRRPVPLTRRSRQGRPFLFTDRMQRLWVYRGMGSLTRVDTKTRALTRWTLPDTAPEAEANVRQMVEDARGRLWTLSQSHGLLRVVDEGLRSESEKAGLGSRAGLLRRAVSALPADNGALWLGCSDGTLLRYDADRALIDVYQCRLEDLAPDSEIRILGRTRDGRLWLALGYNQNQGLAIFNPRDSQFSRLTDPETGEARLRDIEAYSFLESESGSVWIGAYGQGAFRYEPDDETLTHCRYWPKDDQSLGGDMIVGIYQDRSGLLWFASESGVSMLDPRQHRFNRYDGEALGAQTRRGSNVRSLMMADDGALWVGTMEGAVRLNPSRTRARAYKMPVRDSEGRGNMIGALTTLPDGTIVAGTWGQGLFQYQPETDRFSRFKGQALDEQIYAANLFIDREGRLWICTLDSGVIRLDLATQAVRQYEHDPDDPRSLPLNDVIPAWEEPNGDIWFGTLGGGLALLHRETDAFTTFRHDPQNPQSLSSDGVRALLRDRRGRLWVGVHGGGLNRYHEDRGVFEAFTEQDGLPNNTIYAILEDREGRLWLSANAGLCRFDPDSGATRNFDVGDGLQGLEFNTAAYFHSEEGEMFFGGVAGFNAFFPEDIELNRYPPPVSITRVKAFDRETAATGDSVALSYRENFITIEFAALSYAQHEKNRYAYQLEGVDADWVHVGHRRYASYTDLDPGEYLFRVKAANHDGFWNESGASLRMIIQPPFWRTPWFMGLVAFLLAALLYAGHYWRTRGIYRRQRLLERMVHNRTEQLERAKRQAERANELKSAFLAKMTHEIRTPLNAIIGFAESMKSASLAADDRQSLGLIHESSDTLLQLVNDVLDFHKIEQQKLKLEQAPFDLEASLRTALHPYEHQAAQRGLAFRLSFDDALPRRVIGDSTRVMQIALNLVSNALKFTHRGGVAASFRLDALEDRQAWISGEVVDSGIGIPPEKQDYVFQSFAQADDSITRQFGGSGLGLSIVRELTTMMDGNIGLTSPVPHQPFPEGGPGACFWFTLRLTLDTTPQKPQSEWTPAKPAAEEPLALRLLAVEDNKTNQILIAKILRDLGATCHIAHNGQEALELVDGQFDLVLMDVQMPLMDGYEATRRLKRRFPDLPVIGLSANVYKEAIDKCFEAGMDDYIGKPFKKRELSEKLRKWAGAAARSS